MFTNRIAMLTLMSKKFKSFDTHAEAAAYMAGSARLPSFVEVHDAGRVTRIDLTDRVRAALMAAGVFIDA